MYEIDGQTRQLSDEDMLTLFQNTSKRPPCTILLNAYPIALNQETMCLRMRFELDEKFINPMGSIQGGIIGAMLDETFSTCCVIASQLTKSAPTLEMKVSYLRPLFPGRCEVEAQIIRMGKSIAFAEAKLFDHNDKLTATASATIAPKYFQKMS